MKTIKITMRMRATKDPITMPVIAPALRVSTAETKNNKEYLKSRNITILNGEFYS